MMSFLLWYVAVTLLGWITFPVAFRLLPGLADRGYTLARTLGWLLWGYIFWLLASFRILQNNLGGELLALGLVIALSLWMLRNGWFGELRTWIGKNTALILTAELVFLAFFGFWTVMRAADPAIVYTEKPMEIAFINAILRSPMFPPSDPWLSGFSISYYYFGYVLVAMLTRITGVLPEVAFNLAVALLFGLTALGAYGLVYNLLKARRKDQDQPAGLLGLPILGPLFILLVSNLEGLLEVLHARGLFWKETASGLQSGFWTWLDVLDLTSPPRQPFTWEPTRPVGSILWRASRVLNDYMLNGASKEVIDEFPFFSYQLGDLHPHVLAMPFALLVIGLGLHFFLDKRRPGFSLFGLWIPMDPPALLLTILALGSLGFLNTWDFPIYVALFAGAYAVIRYWEEGWTWQRLGDFVGLAVVLGLGGILLYLPFYVGFASQAKGFLPSLVFFTRGVHFWIMFAPLLIPIAAFLFYLIGRTRETFSWVRGLINGILVVGGLWVLSYFVSIAATLVPQARGLFLGNQVGDLPVGIGTLIAAATLKRFQAPGTWLTLLVLFIFLFGLLVRSRQGSARVLVVDAEVSDSPAEQYGIEPVRRADGFVVLLILLGALLTIGPEYFYLLDLFGVRMNTIFKFYYQAWLVWGIASAYGSAVLLSRLRGLKSVLFGLGWVVLILAALINPVLVVQDRIQSLELTKNPSLDGLNALANYLGEDEIKAIDWLRQAPLGIVAEAVGGSYDSVGGSWVASARISRYTGNPTVMGWPGHENQWGRSYDIIGLRENDIETLYRTGSWDEAKTILDRYQIRYVVVGGSERTIYRVNETKFDEHLAAVFRSGGVTIYEVPGRDSSTIAAFVPEGQGR